MKHDLYTTLLKRNWSTVPNYCRLGATLQVLYAESSPALSQHWVFDMDCLRNLLNATFHKKNNIRNYGGDVFQVSHVS